MSFSPTIDSSCKSILLENNCLVFKPFNLVLTELLLIEPDIRASEGIPGKGPNSKMKAYQSRLFGSANANRSKERNLMKTSNDNAYRYQSLLEECERCRTILQQTQHSEVVEAFRSDWDLSR